MEIELETLKEIAAEYFDIGDEKKFNDNWEEFMYCYEIIRNHPYVMKKYDINLIDCLYFVASDIASNDFFKTTTDCYGNKFDNYTEKSKSLDTIIGDALYRGYDLSKKLTKNYIRTLKVTM